MKLIQIASDSDLQTSGCPGSVLIECFEGIVLPNSPKATVLWPDQSQKFHKTSGSRETPFGENVATEVSRGICNGADLHLPRCRE